jgi:PHD/YefM family antitoxin component YafN of YafNO toxin-antitoxin module
MEIELSHSVPKSPRWISLTLFFSGKKRKGGLGERVFGVLNRQVTPIALQLEGLEKELESADIEIKEMPRNIAKLSKWLNRLQYTLQKIDRDSPNFNRLQVNVNAATESLARIKAHLVNVISINKLDSTEYLLSSGKNRTALSESLAQIERKETVTYSFEEFKKKYG